MWYKVDEDKEMTVGQIRKYCRPSTLPAVLTPHDMTPFGIEWAEEDPAPAITNLQKLTPGAFEEIDGSWFRHWIISDRFDTQEEIDTFLAQEAADEAQVIEQAADQEIMAGDTVIQYIKNNSLSTIRDKVNADVVDLASAKKYLMRSLLINAYIIKKLNL